MYHRFAAYLPMLVFFGCMSACTNNLSTDYDAIARQCGVAAQAETGQVALIRFTLSPQNSEVDPSLIQLALMDAKGNPDTNLKVNGHSCLQLGSDAKGHQLIARYQMPHQILYGSLVVSDQPLQTLDLQPLALEMTARCAQQNWFWDGQSTPDISKAFHISGRDTLPNGTFNFWLEQRSADNQPKTWRLADNLSLSDAAQEADFLALIRDDQRFVLQAESLFGDRLPTTDACHLQRLPQSPSLVIESDHRIDEEIYLAHDETLRLGASSFSQIKACLTREPKACSEDQASYEDRSEISGLAEGIWYLEAYAEDPLQRRSKPVKRTLFVVKDLPNIAVYWPEADHRFSAMRLHPRPRLSQKVGISVNHTTIPKHRMAETQTCRLSLDRLVWQRGKVSMEKVGGFNPVCLNKDCEKQALDQWQACQDTLEFSWNTEWQRISPGRLNLEVRLSTPLGQTLIHRSHLWINEKSWSSLAKATPIEPPVSTLLQIETVPGNENKLRFLSEDRLYLERDGQLLSRRLPVDTSLYSFFEIDSTLYLASADGLWIEDERNDFQRVSSPEDLKLPHDIFLASPRHPDGDHQLFLSADFGGRGYKTWLKNGSELQALHCVISGTNLAMLGPRSIRWLTSKKTNELRAQINSPNGRTEVFVDLSKDESFCETVSGPYQDFNSSLIQEPLVGTLSLDLDNYLFKKAKSQPLKAFGLSKAYADNRQDLLIVATGPDRTHWERWDQQSLGLKGMFDVHEHPAGGALQIIGQSRILDLPTSGVSTNLAGLLPENLAALVALDDQRILILSEYHLFQFDTKTQQFARFDFDPTLNANIEDIYVDRTNHILWLSRDLGRKKELVMVELHTNQARQIALQGPRVNDIRDMKFVSVDKKLKLKILIVDYGNSPQVAGEPLAHATLTLPIPAKDEDHLRVQDDDLELLNQQNGMTLSSDEVFIVGQMPFLFRRPTDRRRGEPALIDPSNGLRMRQQPGLCLPANLETMHNLKQLRNQKIAIQIQEIPMVLDPKTGTIEVSLEETPLLNELSWDQASYLRQGVQSYLVLSQGFETHVIPLREPQACPY